MAQCRVSRLLLFSLCCLPFALGAQVPMQVPSDTLLAGISERGRLLVQYDLALRIASRLVRPVAMASDSMNASLAHLQSDGKWIVRFGRVTAAEDTFFVRHQVAQVEADSFMVVPAPVPAAAAGEDLLALRAVRTAAKVFRGVVPNYNISVLPRSGGGFWVYFLPAQTRSDAFTYGADARYQISANGDTILARRQMHATLMNTPARADAVAGMHTAILDDVPEDSDVFLAMARFPYKSEVIATPHYNYEIHIDGSITYQRANRGP